MIQNHSADVWGYFLTIHDGSPRFPIESLPFEAAETFEDLKKMVEKSFVTGIDESIPLEVKTDASEVELMATLSQDGKPITFFSRSLQGSELNLAAIEKDAQANTEAVRHWKHFITGQHLT